MDDVRMTRAEGDWQRLGEMLVARRVAKGFRSRRAFATHLGLSHDRTLFDIENGKRQGGYDPSTLAFIEMSYGWLTGSIRRVLAGGDPTPFELTAENPAQPVGLGLDAEADGLPPEDVEAVRAQVRALKRARGLDS